MGMRSGGQGPRDHGRFP